MERKRAPGAGRKPMGEFAGKSSAFSTRITPELRAAMDEESERTGQSVSQIVERRLRESFDHPKRLHRSLGPEHIRALAYAVARVAMAIETETSEKWNEDAWTFEAMFSAIKTVVQDFKPAGDATVPDKVSKRVSKLMESGANTEAFALMNEPLQYGLITGVNFLTLLNEAFDQDKDAEWRDYNTLADDEHLLPFIKRSISKETGK